MRLLVLAGVSAMLWGQQRPVVSARRILTEAEENYCTCAMPSLDAEALVRVDRRGALEQSTDQRISCLRIRFAWTGRRRIGGLN